MEELEGRLLRGAARWWSPRTRLGTPKAFDLITDPKEEYPATCGTEHVGLQSSPENSG
jgi:hypothetical protein